MAVNHGFEMSVRGGNAPQLRLGGELGVARENTAMRYRMWCAAPVHVVDVVVVFTDAEPMLTVTSLL